MDIREDYHTDSVHWRRRKINYRKAHTTRLNTFRQSTSTLFRATFPTRHTTSSDLGAPLELVTGCGRGWGCSGRGQGVGRGHGDSASSADSANRRVVVVAVLVEAPDAEEALLEMARFLISGCPSTFHASSMSRESLFI